MKRILCLLCLFLTTIVLSACMDSINIDEEKVELTISLIDAMTEESEESILLAQQSFDDLNEHEKKEVTNYTKLYFFSNYQITYIDLQITRPSDDSKLAYFPPVSYFHQITSREELIEKFSFESDNDGEMISFSDGELDKLNENSLKSQFVLAVTVPYYWEALPNDENIQVYYRTDDKIDIRFIKFDVTWFYEFHSYYIRIIYFNTNQKVSINSIPFLSFNPDESQIYREMNQ